MSHYYEESTCGFHQALWVAAEITVCACLQVGTVCLWSALAIQQLRGLILA